MDYIIRDLTKKEAGYIGDKINEVVPREVYADEEDFVLKVENENGEIIGNDDDANIIQNGIAVYSEAYEQECENAGFYKKLVDKDGRFIAGVIADAEKNCNGFVKALFVEEQLRLQGLGTYLLKEAEEFAKENGASMILTNAGDWNVAFFKKNGYLLRGELKDVPKGHNCYELYKKIKQFCED